MKYHNLELIISQLTKFHHPQTDLPCLHIVEGQKNWGQVGLSFLQSSMRNFSNILQVSSFPPV